MIILSIIIPVYNTEKYIRRCITSIMMLEEKEIEIIIVNDGSSDNTGAICAELAQKDQRIKYYDKINGGVSDARNYGISMSSGKYISFVDADDYIGPDRFLGLKGFDDNQVDFIYNAYTDIIENEEELARPLEERLFSVNELKELYKSSNYKYFPAFVWCGFYKTEIIKQNNLLFKKDVSLGEDALFNMSYMNHCKAILFVDNQSYYHSNIHTSLVHQYYSERCEKEKNECATLENFCGSHNFRGRYYHWHLAINHYKKWKKDKDKTISRDAVTKLKKVYKDPYFRESIPFIRSHGTVDERIETRFMSYYTYWIYEGIIKLWSRVYGRGRQ